MRLLASLLALVLWTALSSPRPSAAALPTSADSTEALYAQRDVAALQRLLRQTTNRELALLCRYRLYPLTQDSSYLDDLPTDLADGSPRELALLSGLWGYRVLETSIFKIPTYGRRATRLLEQARALDPDEPFVLLIGGQSLLFRPGIFGGDKQDALVHFQRLCQILPRRADAGISHTEANLWVWYTLKKLEDAAATPLRERLLAQNLPPLYRSFLLDPP